MVGIISLILVLVGFKIIIWLIKSIGRDFFKKGNNKNNNMVDDRDKSDKI